LCFEKQTNRNNTVFGILKHAICLLPKRPEAYFLISRLCEREKKYTDGYTYAEIGLKISDSLKGIDDVEYPGEYGLLFEKAVCSWWWGKHHEARKLFSEISEKYVGELDELHQKSVESNLISLGSGPESISFVPYTKEKHNKLKFKFPGSETIDKNYSQTYQDMFILAALEGKKNGTFLEIGGYLPYRGNNTALLEENFGWTGTTIEIKKECCDEYSKFRKTKIICADALTVNYEKILSEIANKDGMVDYLQLDCEPPKITFEILLSIPFHKYTFGVITFEHDYYLDMSKSYRDKSRKFLKSQGYELVAGNISPTDIANFEDWWIHPDYVRSKTIEKLMCVDKNILKVEDYMLA
jgi:hypothetical protein